MTSLFITNLGNVSILPITLHKVNVNTAMGMLKLFSSIDKVIFKEWEYMDYSFFRREDKGRKV